MNIRTGIGQPHLNIQGMLTNISICNHQKSDPEIYLLAVGWLRVCILDINNFKCGYSEVGSIFLVFWSFLFKLVNFLIILLRAEIMKRSKALFLKLYEGNPEQKKIDAIVKILQNDGVIIYPTDTVYALGCSIISRNAIDKLARLKGFKQGKKRFSLIFENLSHVSEYAKNIHTPVFKVMKKAFPGPFTFILPSNNKLPKLLNTAKKTVGVRVPRHNIPRAIVQELGNPIITTSIRDEDEIIEYSTDPGLIFEKFQLQVDAIIDGGYGNNIPSTVIDCTGDEFEILREGLGDINTIL